MMASAKRLATLTILQQGGSGSKRYSIVSVSTSSLMGLCSILAAEPARENAVRDAGVDVLGASFLAADGHLDQGAARDREVVDDQDVLAADLTDDVEHLGLLVVPAPGLVAEDDRGVHHLAELVGLLAEADVGGGHDQVGDLLGPEVSTKTGIA